jgi:regulator of nonsense transcripts 2
LTYNPEWELGRRELVGDNPLDSPRDTVRIIMVVTILDNCGTAMKERNNKDKLERFIHFFQIYILSKVSFQ